MSNPERLGEIISRRKSPARKGSAAKIDLLALNWTRVAGDRISGHTAPTRLARGVLTVSAEGQAWASEASTQTEAIRRRAESLLGGGTVRKVRVRAGAADWREADPDQAVDAARASAEGIALDEEITDVLSEIPGDETRLALERLLKASKAGRLPRKQ